MRSSGFSTKNHVYSKASSVTEQLLSWSSADKNTTSFLTRKCHHYVANSLRYVSTKN